MESDDAELLRRCRAGEQAACAQLVQQHARMVGTLIWRIVRDDALVEDLAQESFLRVFRALPLFEGRARLSTWICTVAQRVALDHLRARRRRPEQPLATAVDESESDALERLCVAVHEDTAAEAEREQLLQQLRAEIDRLPEKYRLPLVYAGVDGLDYDAIAALLDIPVGTVKTHIHRGRLILKERLGPLND